MTSRAQRRHAPTMSDVAKLAGVSAMTVSRVVNGDPKVSPATRKRIERTIAEIGYAPHLGARALAGGELKRIGFLYGDSGSATAGDLLANALEEAEHRQVQIVVGRYERRKGALQAARRLVGCGVFGMLLPPPLDDMTEVLDFLAAAGLPSVSLACGKPGGSLYSISIDDHRAAFTMTRHLLALGHSRIGFVIGDPRQESSVLRLQGYRAALEKAGLPFRKELVAQGFGTFRSGLGAGEALLGLTHRPTAIFASSDEMAAAIVAVAHRQGFALPLELTVCGFGDSAVASAISPELTTIRMPLREMARAAVNLRVELPPGSRRQALEARIVDFALVRRQSDAMPDPLARPIGRALAL